MRNFIGLSVALASVVLLSSCETMEGRWKDAKQTDVSQVYEEFLQDYPDSPFEQQARNRMEDMKYADAKKVGTAEAYEEFLKDCRNNDYAIEAREAIKQLRYDLAIEANTLSAYEDFIDRYPTGDLTEDVQSRARPLFLAHAEAEDSLQAYEDFVKMYPSATDSPRVKKRLFALRLEQAKAMNTLDAYQSFIESCGDSPLVEEAKSLALPLFKVELSEQATEAMLQAEVREHTNSCEAFLAWYKEGEEAEWGSERLADAKVGLLSLQLAQTLQQSHPQRFSLRDWQLVTDDKGTSPAHETDLGLLRALLEQGADVNRVRIIGFRKAGVKEVNSKVQVHSSGSNGTAIDAGNGDRYILLRMGDEIVAGRRDDIGISLLEFALQNHMEDVAELLKSFGARITEANPLVYDLKERRMRPSDSTSEGPRASDESRSAATDAAVEGVILKIHEDRTAAVISIGSADGVREGTRLHVIRGNKFICDLVVGIVKPHASAGLFRIMAGQPQVGDRVTSSLE